MNTIIHIGEEIRNHLTAKSLSVAWLATQLNCDPSNLRKMLKNTWFPTDLLYRISLILGRDFFAGYSRQLKEECTAGIIHPKNG